MFRFAGSVLPRGGRALQADLAVCAEHSPSSGHTGFAPRRGVCAFPVYTAQAPGCSVWSGPCVVCGSSFPVFHKSAESVGPAFCAFPTGAAQAAGSLPGALSLGAARLLPSAAPASVSVPASPVRLVSVLGSWPLAATLPADVDHPESQEVFKSSVRTWRPVCSLVGEALSGAEFAPKFPLPLPPASCLRRGWAGAL